MKMIKLLCVTTFMLFTSIAIAQDNNGASVIDEFGCVVISADSGLPVDLITEVSHFVENSAGNVNMWCDFVFDPALCPSDKAMKHKGFPCGTLAGLATKTMATTDCEYGVVHMSCQVK
jgi:hypothetical protein